ncbi:MAG: phospho-N-acetylmuramoyl-pentapeptide-transferase [Clostridia bacterium]|nr:phospho-N-acetylmuramoyl-pentapeptide-transferase [Clostridia bacterium]
MNIHSLLWLVLLSVFFISVIGISWLLPYLTKKKLGQSILEIGPKWHKTKEGTPTMGGLAPALAICGVGFLLLLLPYTFTQKEKVGVALTLLYGLSCASIGFIDDLTKFRKHQNAGLTPKQKLVLQFAFCGAYLALLHIFGFIDTNVMIPFLPRVWHLGWCFYPLALLFAVGSMNFVNLTDGIDGLASSVCVIVAGFFVFCATKLQQMGLLSIAAAMLAGAFAFLLFNYHPARIFMGDTGSLFFGGLSVGCAFLCGMPLLLLTVGIVFYLEGRSVTLQVLYYKISGGKRLFKMAPLHHHLEKSGWTEEKIVFVFTLISLFGAVLGAFAL